MADKRCTQVEVRIDKSYGKFFVTWDPDNQSDLADRQQFFTLVGKHTDIAFLVAHDVPVEHGKDPYAWAGVTYEVFGPQPHGNWQKRVQAFVDGMMLCQKLTPDYETIRNVTNQVLDRPWASGLEFSMVWDVVAAAMKEGP